MLIGAFSYADFVAVAKKLENTDGVFYILTAVSEGSGFIVSFTEHGENTVFTFFQNDAGPPTQAQVLADFPGAVQIANVLSLVA